MRHLDLFSGIGGFALGLQWAGGFETIGFCEIDAYCQKVLSKHWPGVPIHSDIRGLDGRSIGPVDIVTGGFPCQPFSAAGQRRGAEDDRHLWPEMVRVISECRPAWVIGENVAGLASLGLDDVLSDLETLGYASQTFDIPAVAVDAKHRRHRLWIVAHRSRHEPGREEQRAAHNGLGRREQQQECSKGARHVAYADGCDAQAVEPWRNGEEQRQVSRNGPPRLCGGKSAGQWLPEPDVGRVAYGVPKRVDRLKGLGNAVVPQIPQAIGEAIMAAERA